MCLHDLVRSTIWETRKKSNIQKQKPTRQWQTGRVAIEGTNRTDQSVNVAQQHCTTLHILHAARWLNNRASLPPGFFHSSATGSGAGSCSTALTFHNDSFVLGAGGGYLCFYLFPFCSFAFVLVQITSSPWDHQSTIPLKIHVHKTTKMTWKHWMYEVRFVSLSFNQNKGFFNQKIYFQ